MIKNEFHEVVFNFTNVYLEENKPGNEKLLIITDNKVYESYRAGCKN